MTMQPTMLETEEQIALQLDRASRSFRLREMYWAKTHEAALVHKKIVGCGEKTLLGYAKDFATLLETSDPLIQEHELIVGCCLALPEDKDALDLGYYNSHYPPGHSTLLRMGLAGIRDHARARLREETDPAKREFLRAVELSYDAACQYVRKYAARATALAAAEPDPRRRAELERIAAACEELATRAPSSFHAALQLVQFTRVFGGRGCIGRFDQWMVPFYRRDIAEGRITQEQAQELLECLFIKLNYFPGINEVAPEVYVPNDTLRNIALAGQTPRGEDACNALTYMCLEASAKLMLPEPKLNVRFFHDSPPRLLRECCRVLAKGANVLAIFNDEVAVPALRRMGIPLEDARDYCNDGCSELIIGGKCTITFKVHDALPALTETALRAEQQPYAAFDEVLADLKSRLESLLPKDPGPKREITFPYFAASIEDCLPEASPAGTRYDIRGSILAQVGNAADGLAAIKKLIYEDKALTWEELVTALKANYDGYETLRQMIRNRAPKYGNDNDMVDALAKEIAEYFCDVVHQRAHNTPEGGVKWGPGFMSFGIHRKNDTPTSPDGRRRGDLTASSFSPSIGMDRSGPTAVLKSVAKVDLRRASHGSVLDIALHGSVMRDGEGLEKLVALADAFLKLPCTTTLQVNVIDRDMLLRARANPELPEFKTLIVRVWGFSAVFVELPPALQEHVLARTEHGFN